jgi:nucleotide-binding universal stress UspA family protein
MTIKAKGQVRDTRGRVFKTIVWATDGSEAADRAFPYAMGLAQEPARTLVIIYAKGLAGGRDGGVPQHGDGDDIEAKIRCQVDEAQKAGIAATLKVVTGAAPGPAQMIVSAASGVGADLIIVGCHGHSPAAGLFFGSVTNRLLHIAPCPVLAVPPPHTGETDPLEGGSVEAGDQPEGDLRGRKCASQSDAVCLPGYEPAVQEPTP